MSGPNGSDLFKSLNKAQSRAVSSQAPTVAILAGPGSGKTHTLTSRVVWLIDHVGIRPCDVIVATFTVKASNEMKSRIGQALGDGRGNKIVLGTFHSIARRYLAAYGKHIGLDPKFGIADDHDSSAIIKRICKRLSAPLEPAVARGWISKRKAKGTSDERFVKAKNGKDIESQSLEQCYQEYQAHLERSNLLDYDDLLVRCVELLRDFPHCVSNIQTVLIDEFQDTNGVQYDLMKLFAQKNKRITIVGDPDQSIYGWRSAEIRNLYRLLRDFPGTDEISLEENYRSSSSILDVSLKVIQQDRDRYKKILLPVHDKGVRPVFRMLKSSMTEADWIVSEIKRIKLMSGNMVKSDDVAILLRSASLSRHIEGALGREGINYKMVGGFKFYERVEIKAILDYLRVISQPENNDALARIINVPKRGVGEVTVKSLLEEAERNAMSLWDLLGKHCRGERIAKTTIRKQPEQKISGGLIRLITSLRVRLRPSEGEPINLVELINRLLQDLQFEKHLEETHGPEYESKWANVQEFVSLAEEFMNQDKPEDDKLPAVEETEQTPDNDILARFLANISLASDKQTDKDTEGQPQVTVSTIHAAKGLEWPVVFVPAVYKGSIPHMRSDDESEERRLLYVAMTRAQALLYLSCPLHVSNGSSDSVQISPFIQDLPSSTFAKQGPSLDRPAMLQVAKLLRRDLPRDDVIYRGMPMMAAVEDTLFPVDPNEAQAQSANGSIQRAGQFKRQKINHSSGGRITDEAVDNWATPYATTMQKSSSFTVPQPPPAQSGFTTAGAHYATVTAAEAARSVSKPPQGASSSSSKRPPASRAPTQRSLLGFGYGVANHDRSRPLDDAALPPMPSARSQPPSGYAPRHQRQAQRGGRGGVARQPPHVPPSDRPAEPGAAAIAPSLASHKLGSARLSSRPTAAGAAAAGGDPAPPPATKPKEYACFSSSPPRSPGEKENAAPSPPQEPTRPTRSFHATTVLSAARPAAGGIQRPLPLTRGGITPMDRLKRPFKPPTTVRRPA
ncbi:P-loop containing nucleoside triphosphate hydrolase protein [Durotheca rogersii]|uniref:P-loop containing nucleoside triphosphate hydrolase protein n=1 Tax=Durotheca rogersii TaxID=419775 RepID=UPI002220F64B|nr:P-loop containing nucleoside triphosphate hydrolase protein [Durotheca rogersii]KAI5861361.1 P-loop containing nucleoside triphosphate hydrolase protein [Durotheca rogersii]